MWETTTSDYRTLWKKNCCWEQFYFDLVSQGNLSWVKGQGKNNFKNPDEDEKNLETKLLSHGLAYWWPGHSSWGRDWKSHMGLPPVGLSTTRGAARVCCNVDWMVKGGDTGILQDSQCESIFYLHLKNNEKQYKTNRMVWEQKQTQCWCGFGGKTGGEKPQRVV